MHTALWAACTLIVTLSAAAAPLQPLVLVYQVPELGGGHADLRPAPKSARLSNQEQALIRTEILPAAREYWRGRSASCNRNGPDGFPDDFRIDPSVAPGSFTRPRATQKAILYSYCQTGHNFAYNGIVVFEADRVVAHIAYEGGWSGGIVALPDIDGNGQSEILIITGGTSMGAGWQVISVIALSEKGVRNFGHTETYSGDCDSQSASSKGTETTYRLFVREGPKPVFYRETFIGDCGKPTQWRQLGNRERITLRDTAQSPNTSWSMNVKYVRLK
jgi:hypothetical protein